MRSIGVVRSGHLGAAGTPIQPRFAAGCEGTVEVGPEFVEGLRDLDGFERIWLIYLLDRAAPWRALVRPFRDTVERGLFATRAPARPNRIGMSAVRLLGITGGTLRVGEVDILDGTQVLDIKPYVPAFDAYPEARAGWLEDETVAAGRADDRFED